MKAMDKYYCYCPKCNEDGKAKNFFAKAKSLHAAKLKLEEHEKALHKGKPVGTFGKGHSYPKGIKHGIAAILEGILQLFKS